MTATDLNRIAAVMYDLGFRVLLVDSEGCGTSIEPGLHVGEHFFTSAEPDDACNLAFLVNGMFEQIVQNRVKVGKDASPQVAERVMSNRK